MNSVLPSILRQSPHLLFLDLMVKERMDNLAVDAVLVYLIDTVSEDALEYLAMQFDVMGYKGWKLADTVEKKRELIKNAIQLHRYKGTPFAVKNALRSIGYAGATLTERTSHWSDFTIDLNLGTSGFTSSQINEVEALINTYKNARSHLQGVVFSMDVDDAIVLVDDSYEGPADEYGDGITVGGDFRYNGLYTHDGTKNYSSDTDILELTII